MIAMTLCALFEFAQWVKSLLGQGHAILAHLGGLESLAMTPQRHCLGFSPTYPHLTNAPSTAVQLRFLG